MLLRRNAVFGGGIFHLLTVFIGSGEEIGIIPHRTVKTCQHISKNGRIGVPDMGFVIDVVNRCCHIKFAVHKVKSSDFHIKKYVFYINISQKTALVKK